MYADAQKPGDGTSGVRLPTHEVIYRRLRELILFGELAPGQAVTIQGLCETLSAGMTPVREAIRRLIAEGAIEFNGNRRVRVPVLTPANIRELSIARQWLDPYLTERATSLATARDIDMIETIDIELDDAILRGDLRAYLALNHKFHKKIYDIADVPILAKIAESLWLRFGPSLRVVCGRVGTQGLPDMHKQILHAMRAGDPKAAARAIHEDVIQGMEQVRQSLERS